jgi:hypothetical protein
MPSEVRDDVDIKASEGEFIVPADVVRFLGLEKLEGLVNKAKESLAEMSKAGRIGGKPMPPKTPTPPQPSGITPPQPMGGPPRPMGMAEGGVVAPQPTGATGGLPQATMMAYEGPDGKVIYVPVLNGQPITSVPAGYKPIGGARQAMGQGQPSPRAGSSGGGGTSFLNTPQGAQVNKPRSPQEWTVDDFINYGQQIQGGGADAVMGVINTLFPVTNILTGLAERNMQTVVPGMLDTMIEIRVDAQGNAISDEQLEGLVNTRTAMADRIANETGTSFNPFENITNFVSRLTNRNRQQPSQQNSVSNPTSSNTGEGSSPSFSIRGGTAAPDKEEKNAGAKGFAYGGLVTKKPKQGFLKK